MTRATIDDVVYDDRTATKIAGRWQGAYEDALYRMPEGNYFIVGDYNGKRWKITPMDDDEAFEWLDPLDQLTLYVAKDELAKQFPDLDIPDEG